MTDNNADVDCKLDYGLCNGLWYADVRCTVLFHSNNGSILRIAETVCRRYHWCSEIIKMKKDVADSSILFCRSMGL